MQPCTRRVRTAGTLVASLLLVAGCGSARDETGSPGSGSAGAAPATTELTIRVVPGAGRPERTFTLVCDPAGGDHPQPQEACSALEDAEKPFAPVPSDVMCTEVYGGPQTAQVTGTYAGRQVDASFSRVNGCEIARWDEHRALLVARGGADR
jgi:hypothetical protein